MNQFSKIINFLVNFIESGKNTQDPNGPIKGGGASAGGDNVDGFLQKLVETLSSYLNAHKKGKNALTILLLFEHEAERDSINVRDRLEYIAQQVKLQSGVDITLEAKIATLEQWKDEEKYPKLLSNVAFCIVDNFLVPAQNACAYLIPIEGYADKIAQPSIELNTDRLNATHQFFLIGRGGQTITRNGTPRRNDIVIANDIHQVSRSHARIGYDKGQKSFFIKVDEGGIGCGTRVFHRDGSDWIDLSSPQVRIYLREEDVIELGGVNGIQLLFKLQN